jgi:hypothetical protein
VSKLALAFPLWYLILCLILGMGFAFFLYFRDKQFANQPFLLRLSLATLRGISASLLAILLLSPVLKHYKKEVKQPLVIFGQDVSNSVMANMSDDDSLAYVTSVQELMNGFSDGYDVRMYKFGEEVRAWDSLQFTDKASDISAFLNYVEDHFADQNLGAVILSTDGLYNRGQNPLYPAGSLTFPVHAIAMGDTTIHPDQQIKAVFHNQIAYLGDRVAIQVDLQATRLNGQSAQLSVEKSGRPGAGTLDRKTLRIDEDQWLETVEFIVEADKPGVNQYRLSLSGVGGESSYANNSKLIAIEVIDSRQKILLLGASPHPDLTAIKATIESHKNYEVTLDLLDQFNGKISAFDLVILHQLPSVRQGAGQIFNQLEEHQVPRLFVLGELNNLSAFNTVQSLMSIEGAQRNPNDIQASVNPAFDLFTIDDNLRAAIESFVPMQAPYGNYTVSPSANVFLFQRIGKVETEYPLLLFSTTNTAKTGILAGEGYWRWRLYDYLVRQDHEMSQDVLQKSVQYLTIKEDKRRFRVASNKVLYLENEEIEFSAELYNESFQLVTGPDILLTVRDQEGNEYQFTFNRYDNTYRLHAGRFPVGRYFYQAHTDYDGQRMTAEGGFTVQAIQLEAFESTANHRLLHSISDATGGSVSYPDQLESIANAILQNENIKPVLYQSLISRSVIHLKWIAFLLIFMLCLEWFLRRYFGGY